MRYIKTKNWKKLDTEIVANIKNILHECELYNKEDEVYVLELNKMRKWEIQEEIGNYLNADLYDREFCLEGKHMKTFCKAFDITEDEVAYYYARAIAESGYCLAYEITKDMVLVIE